MKKFVSTMRKGFHMTFENGLEVSVQWGAGNYCDNHFPIDNDFTFSKDAVSNTAEVAVFKGNDFADIDKFLPEGCSSDGLVAGYLTPEQVVDFIANVKNYNVGFAYDLDKQITLLFKDIASAPTGGVDSDFNIRPLNEQLSDAFIKILAGHLVANGWRKET